MDQIVRAWRAFRCWTGLWLGGHRLVVIARCSEQSDHIGCRDCDREWGMNHSVSSILPWDLVRDFYLDVGQYDEAAARQQFRFWRAVR